MRRTIAAAALAAGGLLTFGLGVPTQTRFRWRAATRRSMPVRLDGPQVEIAQGDADYSHWDCRQGDDGLWYVWLSS